MKKILFNLYFWSAFLLTTIVGLTLLPFILIINLIFLGRGPAKTLRLAIRIYGYILVCIVPFKAPVKVIGNINAIPTPCILVANHTSAIDPYLFGAIPIENCFVTSWPFKIPVYGPLMRLAGYVNIEDGWENMKKQCTARLRSGSSVTIWPEGHRSRDGRMGRFRKGAFQLAVETGSAIQPVCIIGSGNIMFPGERALTPGRVSLVLLEPLYPVRDSADPDASARKLRRKTIKVLQKCLNEQHSCSMKSSTASCPIHTPISTETLSGHHHDIC